MDENNKDNYYKIWTQVALKAADLESCMLNKSRTKIKLGLGNLHRFPILLYNLQYTYTDVYRKRIFIFTYINDVTYSQYTICDVTVLWTEGPKTLGQRIRSEVVNFVYKQTSTQDSILSMY